MIRLLLILLLAGSLFPAISFFCFDQLAQQWFVSAFFSLILLLCLLISWIKTGITKEHFENLFSSAATIVVALECIFVFIQLFLFRKLSPVTGTMDSSTGLAINICLLLPFVFKEVGTIRKISKDNINNAIKIKWYFTFVVVVLSIFVILLTRCRTGIICLIIFFLIDILLNRNDANGKKNKTFITVCLLMIVIIITSTNTKQNSNKGRSFIIYNSVELIKSKPITGYPPYGFRLEYMNKQADFFRNNPNSIYMGLADEINHPLNEYVYVWINHGLAGVIVLSLIVVFPIVVCVYRKHIYLLCSLFSILLFSLLSYPFLYPLPVLFLLLTNVTSAYYVSCPLFSDVLSTLRVKHRIRVIIASWMVFVFGEIIILTQFSYCYKWNKVAYEAMNGRGADTLLVFEKLSSHYSDNPYFLYNYMSEAFYAGDLDKAFELSVHLHQMMSSYNLELLSGDICYLQHKYEQARFFYENAMYMCPCRFAPLEGLYKVFDATGNIAEKQKIAVIISEKDVKILSPDIIRIKEQCK